MTNRRNELFTLKDILREFEDIPYNVVTIVGELEPTLYSKLEKLTKDMHQIMA